MAHDILVVDDEADIRMLMCGILKDEGYETREAGNSAQALAVYGPLGFHLILARPSQEPYWPETTATNRSGV